MAYENIGEEWVDTTTRIGLNSLTNENSTGLLDQTLFHAAFLVVVGILVVYAIFIYFVRRSGDYRDEDYH